MTAAYIIRLSWPAWKTWTPKVRKSIIRTVRWQGPEGLKEIYETSEYVGLCFAHIFVGVEKLGGNEGYAHS
jgi:hypothetical protein